MKKILGTVAALAFATVATAGTYNAGSPLPSQFGGGFIPPSADTFKNVQKVAGAGAKLSSAVAKCYSKNAKNFAGGKFALADLTDCLGASNPAGKGATDKYEKAVQQNATKTGGLPPCHNFSSDAGTISVLVRGFNALVYCQSPSGAFIDGSANL